MTTSKMNNSAICDRCMKGYYRTTGHNSICNGHIECFLHILNNGEIKEPQFLCVCAAHHGKIEFLEALYNHGYRGNKNAIRTAYRQENIDCAQFMEKYEKREKYITFCLGKHLRVGELSIIRYICDDVMGIIYEFAMV